MSGPRRIVVEIRPDGSMTAATTGVTGPDCLSSAEIIEQLCDRAVVVDSRLTDDYFSETGSDQVELRTEHEEAGGC